MPNSVDPNQTSQSDLGPVQKLRIIIVYNVPFQKNKKNNASIGTNSTTQVCEIKSAEAERDLKLIL